MSKCSLCGNEVSTLSQKKINNGIICKKCLEQLPKVIRTNILKYSIENLQTIISYSDMLNKDEFSATASYGSLHIDEIHGLFAISDKLDVDNKPIDMTDVFYCLDLKDVGITPKNPAANGQKVTVDFELHCWFEHPNLSFVKIIKTKAQCPTTKVKKDGKMYLDYDFPGDYTMFLKMFNQMVTTAQEKYSKKMQPKFLTKHDIDTFKSQSLFMLADGYTIEDLNDQRDRLMKAFHDIPECSKIIDESYFLLIEKLI